MKSQLGTATRLSVKNSMQLINWMPTCWWFENARTPQTLVKGTPTPSAEFHHPMLAKH
ncbi:MAG: hypothetical protein VXZ82_06055 [Planctomycetota bacterium]|nr:hypothetical protein [Planctomycetota bacterium]